VPSRSIYLRGLFSESEVSGSPFLTILSTGILALESGSSDLLAVDVLVFPILLIIVGASILLKPMFEGKRG
jgi:hypothetical protein